jgi:phenylacetate-CoA ligase
MMSSDPAEIDNIPLVESWPISQGENTDVALALQFQLDDSENWPTKKLAAHQLRQLHGLIQHAARHVPLYRQFLEPLLDVRLDEFTTEQFRRIPILSRQELQDAGPDFYARRMPKSDGPFQESHTSGSTGVPVKFLTSRRTRIMNVAMSFRGHRWQGRNPHNRYANITNMSADNPQKDYRWSWLPQSGPSIRVRLNQPFDRILGDLIDVDPHYIQSHPGALLELVRASKRSGVRLPNLIDLTSYGEHLSREAQAEIEDAWGVPVFNNYSSMEVGAIAIQCAEAGMLHINSENVICEIVDDQGHAVAPGQIGRVVITHLHNFASPFIRYAIGDYAEAGAACSCGRTLPTIIQVMGRTRNALVLPNGDRIFPTRINSILALAPIKQIKIRQFAPDSVRLTYLAARHLTAEEEERITKFIHSRFNFELSVEFELVDEIIHKPGEKYEDFYSDFGS